MFNNIKIYVYIYYSIIPGFNYIVMLSIEPRVILMLSKAQSLKFMEFILVFLMTSNVKNHSTCLFAIPIASSVKCVF